MPQLAITFVVGTLFYIARRVSGGLIVPILLHALYDFALFSHGGSKADVVPGGDTAVLQLQNLVQPTVVILFIVVMVAHKQWMHPEDDLVSPRSET